RHAFHKILARLKEIGCPGLGNGKRASARCLGGYILAGVVQNGVKVNVQCAAKPELKIVWIEYEVRIPLCAFDRVGFVEFAYGLWLGMVDCPDDAFVEGANVGFTLVVMRLP